MKRTWAPGGSVVMAAVAVVALGTTVLVAQRALTEASDVVVRGEGDAILATVVGDLVSEGEHPGSEELAAELKAHEAEGLRYLAVVDRDGHVKMEAGTSRIGTGTTRLGPATRFGERAQVAGILVTPHRRPRPPGPSDHVEHGPPNLPVLVVEFEPPMLAKLRRDLTWIGVVAALSGAVLLAFAVAWSRSARRLAAIEERAAREHRLVALGTMSSVMAHELRNPLASLKGHAQLLVEDLENEKQRQKAARVVTEAERIESLTTSLLDFVRDGPIERVAVTPAELVAQAIADLPRDRIELDLAQAPASVTADAPRLARAIHNLVDNALQAAKSNVELRFHDRTITVRDHGPGLPPGAQIFEPFLTTRVKGTGLGLAVARRIAEQHGGTLDGENHPDGGALFTLKLPS